jgi:response regulator RpfG family c-di-GMP phosphodiesterase
MNENKISILYVDDEINNLNSFKAAFRSYYNVHTASSAEKGLEILNKEAEEISIVITDQRMPVTTGIEFLVSIIGTHPDPIRILLTGYSDIETVIDAVNKGQIFQYVSKPWDEQQFKVIIDRAYEIYALRQENKQLIKSLLRSNEQLEFYLRQKLLS